MHPSGATPSQPSPASGAPRRAAGDNLNFRAGFENAPIAVLIADGAGQIVDCNLAAQQMLRHDRTALCSMSLFDLHLPEDRDAVRSGLASLPRTGCVDGEFRWVRSDGRVIWVSLRAVLMDDELTVAFCQDTTERKSAELEFSRAQQLLEAFIEHAPVGIAMFNREMRYIRSSREWQAAVGATDAVLTGRHHYDDMPAIPAKFVDAHQRGMAGETVRGEDEWPRPDGRISRHRWEVHPWGDAGTETGGIIVLFEDVTHAHAMQAELRQAHKMEALGQLAGGVAHDFNNLLQIIHGYTEMVQDLLASNPNAVKYTGEVLRAAQRASSLTRQLLAFSRRQVFTPSVVDLNAVITTTSKMLKRLLGENIAIEMKLSEPLWLIEADADQLSQVLINLCVNARDAMPRGGRLTISTNNCRAGESGVAGQVHVAAGDYVVMTVRDTGTGMDAEVMQHIFEPFFTTKEAGKGTGLGLSTVYGIVRQSNGHVWVDSMPGEGTSVTVCLPRTLGRPDAMPSETARLSLGGDQTLLIVEDDEDVRRAVAEHLPSLGYQVLTAHPSEAMDLVRQRAGTIDLLITDVVMPGMSGPELAENARAEQPGMAVLFMSGYIDDPVTRHGVVESKAPFLQKPFTLSELAAAIRTALERP